MANFNEAVLTKKGIALLAKAQAGQTGIQFTRAVSGNGSYGADETLTDKTALKDQRQEFPFDKLSVLNDTTVSARFTITNEQASGNLTEGYHVKEVGLYATDPDEGEVLYAIATAVEGQEDYMPAYNSLMPAYITVEFYAEVSNAAQVTIICAGRFITAEEVEAELEKLRTQMTALTGTFVTIQAAKTAHETLEEMIRDAGKVPDGVLTNADKGVVNGVASLDSGGHIPRTQLPYGSGATFWGDKLTFKLFTWTAATSGTGWIGTYVSTYKDLDGEFAGMLVPPGLAYRMLDVFFSLDVKSLYSSQIAETADRLACEFSCLSYKAFLEVGDDKTRTIKVFSDRNLGQTEEHGEMLIGDVSFWPFVIRTDQPGF